MSNYDIVTITTILLSQKKQVVRLTLCKKATMIMSVLPWRICKNCKHCYCSIHLYAATATIMLAFMSTGKFAEVTYVRSSLSSSSRLRLEMRWRGKWLRCSHACDCTRLQTTSLRRGRGPPWKCATGTKSHLHVYYWSIAANRAFNFPTDTIFLQATGMCCYFQTKITR